MDYQGLTLGHPAMDIWTIVYSATDPEYRAAHLDNDLRAYYDVFSTYMDTTVDYAEFKKEVDERRVYGMVMFGESCCYKYFSLFMFLPSRQFLLHDSEPNEAAKPHQGVVEVHGSLQGNTAGRGHNGGPPGHQGDQEEGGGQLDGDARSRIDLIVFC